MSIKKINVSNLIKFKEQFLNKIIKIKSIQVNGTPVSVDSNTKTATVEFPLKSVQVKSQSSYDADEVTEVVYEKDGVYNIKYPKDPLTELLAESAAIAESGTYYTKTYVQDIINLKVPYFIQCATALIYDNKINILCSQGAPKRRIIWNGRSWIIDDNLIPYNAGAGCAVVYNNEIHVLGGTDGLDTPNSYTAHYKWNGSSWVSVSTLPYTMTDRGCAVVYNNEIHIFGGTSSSSYKTAHYKWNGSSWTALGINDKLPVQNSSGLNSACAFVYNNELYVIGMFDILSSDTSKNFAAFYKWNPNGSSGGLSSAGKNWTRIGSLPFGYTNGNNSVVIYNNEIHILSGGYQYNRTVHYKWNGSSWVQVSTLPFEFYNGSAVVLNNEIYIIGGNGPSSGGPDYSKLCYKWNGSSWTNQIDNSHTDTNTINISNANGAQRIVKLRLRQNQIVTCDTSKVTIGITSTSMTEPTKAATKYTINQTGYYYLIFSDETSTISIS